MRKFLVENFPPVTVADYYCSHQFAALRLSAALLRAILLNSLAYTENSKVAKSVENDLHAQIRAFEQQQTVYEAEIRRQKQQYSEKAHECAQLQAEVERLRRANPSSASATRLHSSPFPGPSSPTTASPPPQVSSASMQTPQARYATTQSAGSTPTRIPPPRSVTTSPTRINPYAPTTLPSISSATSSRSSSAASSANSSPSPAPAREFFVPSSGQTSPTPYSRAPTTTVKSGVEALLVRPQQPVVPRSMTAPLPPQGPNQPPPLRLQTRPRPSARYPQVWLPMIEDAEDTPSESAPYYSLGRSGTLRATATPTPTSTRR